MPDDRPARERLLETLRYYAAQRPWMSRCETMEQGALLALEAAAETMRENGRPQGAELIDAIAEEVRRAAK